MENHNKKPLTKSKCETKTAIPFLRRGNLGRFGLLAFLFAFAFFSGEKAIAQTATSVCSAITVTNVPNYPGDIFVKDEFTMGNGQSGCCCFTLNGGVSASMAKFKLQRKNGDGTYTDIGGFQTQNKFTVPSDGKHRVVVSVPAYNTVYCKTEGDPAAKVLNINGQWIGWLGERAFYTTSDIWAGENPPIPTAQFPEVIPGNAPSAIDYQTSGVQVTMDVTGTDPNLYDFFFVAILEMDAPYRYASPGWISGAMPNNAYDLSGFWNTSTGGVFNAWTQYKVQFATGKAGCSPPAWNAIEPVFFVCGAGSGCRFEEKTSADLPVSLFPNPADEYFSFPVETVPGLQGFDLVIQNAVGKTVKTVTGLETNRVEVNDLENGYYIVSLFTGSKKVFTKKLIVQH